MTRTVRFDHLVEFALTKTRAGRAGNSDGARIWRLNFRLSTVVLGKATSTVETLGIEVKEFFVPDSVGKLGFPAVIAQRQ